MDTLMEPIYPFDYKGEQVNNAALTHAYALCNARLCIILMAKYLDLQL